MRLKPGSLCKIQFGIFTRQWKSVTHNIRNMELEIRYHVIRAEAETWYGYLGIENKNTKRRFVFWEGLGEYKIDIIRNMEVLPANGPTNLPITQPTDARDAIRIYKVLSKGWMKRYVWYSGDTLLALPGSWTLSFNFPWESSKGAHLTPLEDTYTAQGFQG